MAQLLVGAELESFTDIVECLDNFCKHQRFNFVCGPLFPQRDIKSITVDRFVVDSMFLLI